MAQKENNFFNHVIISNNLDQSILKKKLEENKQRKLSIKIEEKNVFSNEFFSLSDDVCINER